MRTAKHRRTGLVVPVSAAIHNSPVVDRCIVPTPEGPCGHPLREGENRRVWETEHVAKCAQRNAELIMQERERQHPSILNPWDEDLDRWVKKNRDALLEGRKKI